MAATLFFLLRDGGMYDAAVNENLRDAFGGESEGSRRYLSFGNGRWAGFAGDKREVPPGLGSGGRHVRELSNS